MMDFDRQTNYISRQWSSEAGFADLKEVQGSAMDVDSSGELAFVGGRRCLALINISNSSNLEVKMKQQRNLHQRWDVAKLVWNQNKSSNNFVALSYHNKVDLLTVDPSSISCSDTLSLHTRLVTDLDWNKKASNPILATGSLDGFVYLWDLKTPKNPSITFSSLVAASQVQWSRQEEHTIVTSHEGDLKIWDLRNPSVPKSYISAHTAKILSLDWSYNRCNLVATSGQDCTVKFFDVTGEVKGPTETLTTAVPVWKARFTPFGNGLVTVIIPQLQRKDHSLFLWKTSTRLDYPVHCFYGHKDIVLDFEWIKRETTTEEQSDNDQPHKLEHKMLSWGRDQTLRLWKLPTSFGLQDDTTSNSNSSTEDNAEDQIDDLVKDDLDEDGREEEEEHNNLVRNRFRVEPVNEETPTVFQDQDEDCQSGTSDSREATPGKVRDLIRSSPDSWLKDEFIAVDEVSFKRIKIESINPSRRSCKVTTIGRFGQEKLVLRICFPTSYPQGKIPCFTVGKSSTMESSQRNKILKILKNNAKQQLLLKKGCLESCLKQLDIFLQESRDVLPSPKTLDPEEPFLRDGNVPYPRSCGASFCSNSYLICFGRSTYQRLISSTPRGLSEYGAQRKAEKTLEAYQLYNTVHGGKALVHSPGNSLKRRGRFKVRRVSASHLDDLTTGQSERRVTVYDVSLMLPFQRKLAHSYQIDLGSRAMTCRYNSNLAAQEGEAEKARIWEICSQVADLSNESDIPVFAHPMGGKLLKSIIQCLVQGRDLQMAALISCIFSRGPSKAFDYEEDQIKKGVSSLFEVIDITVESPGSSVFTSPSKSPARIPWYLQPGALPMTSDFSPYHTIHASSNFISNRGINEKLIEEFVTPVYKSSRSNSWSDPYPDHPQVSEEATEDLMDMETVTFLDQDFDDIKRIYADILLNWGLLIQRCHLLKYLSKTLDPVRHNGPEISVRCQRCGTGANFGIHCKRCKVAAMRCSLCQTAVKGLACYCHLCSHGGHFQHMQDWFQRSQRDNCPTGCGCKCVMVQLKEQ